MAEGAFKEKLETGKVRLHLTFKTIECEVENSAPDFVDISKDEPLLSLGVQNNNGEHILEFTEKLELKFSSKDDESDRVTFTSVEDGIWFDLDPDELKEAWVGNFVLEIESKFSRYLYYYIKEANHTLEWLQKDEKSKKIYSLSAIKKRYFPPTISDNKDYASIDIMRSADMIYRAINKIDLRTRSAFVSFNTDKGRLEPLIIGLADKLGYEIKPLEKTTVRKLENDNIQASHIIKLK